MATMIVSRVVHGPGDAGVAVFIRKRIEGGLGCDAVEDVESLAERGEVALPKIREEGFGLGCGLRVFLADRLGDHGLHSM